MSTEAADWRVPGRTARTWLPFWAYVLYFVALFRLCLHEIATITTKCTEKRHECADFAVNPGETSGFSPAGGTDLSGVGAFAPSRVCAPPALRLPSGPCPAALRSLSQPLPGVVGRISRDFRPFLAQNRNDIWLEHREAKFSRPDATYCATCTTH